MTNAYQISLVMLNAYVKQGRPLLRVCASRCTGLWATTLRRSQSLDSKQVPLSGYRATSFEGAAFAASWMHRTSLRGTQRVAEGHGTS